MISLLDKKIEKLILEGYDKFYIYPFGSIGMKIKELLESRYGISNYIIVDNFLCVFNKKIISCKELEGRQWSSKEAVIIASNSVDIYNNIRLEIKKYVPLNNIKDMFPVHSLIDNTDHRIASLAAAGREIYRKTFPENLQSISI